MVTLIIIVVIALALFGAPIFAVLGAFAALGAKHYLPDVPLVSNIGGELVRVFHMATGADGTTLSTIPLFTFMGYVLAESKTADRLVSWANAVVGWVPGGLAIVTVFVCAVFTTVTGASGITIVAVGGLVLPELIKRGYKERFSLGLVTSTGSIGLLFPPALPLIIFAIVYGIAAQASAKSTGDVMTLVDFDMQKFLFAGIVPGIVLVSAVSVYCVYVAIRDGVKTTPFVWRDASRATLKALPELLIPIVMIVALQLGFPIPEAASLTVLYVLVLEGLVYRDIGLRTFPRILRESLRLVGAIFILITAATMLTDYFVNEQIPKKLTTWMVCHIRSKYLFLAALNVMLLAVGCVMDIFSALLVVVPLIASTAAAFGIDGYHLGVIFLLNLEIGFVHPPVGLNLFIASFRFRKPMTELYWAVVPFLLIMLGTLIVVTYVPGLTPVHSKTADTAQISSEGPKCPTDKQTAPVATGGNIPDAGVPIKLDDGGVWQPDHCEDPKIKGDTMAYAECQGTVKSYFRCDKAFEKELDRMECKDSVLHGEDPFAQDGGP